MGGEISFTMAKIMKHETVKAAVEGRLTNAQAAASLGKSVRQVQRLKRKIERSGPAGVLHGNAGRAPVNKTPDAVKCRVMELAEGPYRDFNFSHLSDFLYEEHGIKISDETLRLWLRPLGHGRKLKKRRAHYRKRTRKPQKGDMLFLDGSPHHWFGDDHPPVCLLLCADDATGEPLYGQFQPQEDRDGCFEVCYHVFRKYGLPGAFYLDRGSQFTTTRRGGTHVYVSPDQDSTHFERAMKSLNVALIFANSPQARGRIERMNQSFQDRLLVELKLRNITSCEDATIYLNRIFIPKYSKRFGKSPTIIAPSWRPVPENTDLRSVLCATAVRTVRNDNTVSYNGKQFQLLPSPNRRHFAKARITVEEWFDGSIHIVHQNLGTLSAKPLQENNGLAE